MTGNATTPRRYARVDCHAPAVIDSGAGRFPCVCENLSVAGAFLCCEPVPSTDVVSLTIHLSSFESVKVDGEILYRDPRGCGIRFTHLASAALMALCIFIGTVS